jgi:hypothetical protein
MVKVYFFVEIIFIKSIKTELLVNRLHSLYQLKKSSFAFGNNKNLYPLLYKKAKMNGKYYTLSYYTISGTKLATENDKKL